MTACRSAVHQVANACHPAKLPSSEHPKPFQTEGGLLREVAAVIQVAAARRPLGKGSLRRTDSLRRCGVRLRDQQAEASKGLTPVPENDWRSTRARLAALKRYHPDDSELLADLRRDLKLKHARSYIARLHSELPTLTADDLQELANLLLSPPLKGGEHATAG